MSSFLKSISLTDFRSIKGTVSIPLDAPVVLVHGQNGTGKTSLLSALELSLTGKIPSLYRSDEDYLTHLVHKEAKAAQILTTVDPAILTRSDCQITVQGKQLIGVPLLSAIQGAFFSERCYLAQSTMSRLLELYQGKESKGGDSALTKFVKDLLGLDQLDALVNGLFDAGDQRRLKGALTPYRRTLDRSVELKVEIDRLGSELKTAGIEFEEAERSVKANIETLGLTYSPELTEQAMREVVNDSTDQALLQQTALLRRNINAAVEQWSGLQSVAINPAVAEVEEAAKRSTSALTRWREKEGAEVNQVFATLRSTFSDLPDPEVVGPEKARTEARQAVTKELRRCEELLRRDDEASKNISELDERMTTARARIQGLEEQMSGLFENAGQLAQALTNLLPHITSEDCPVCGRNYAEISDRSLHSHLSDTISSLVESSSRLQSCVHERSEMLRQQGQAERERVDLSSNQLDPETRNSLSRRKADLEELERVLLNLADSTVLGERYLSTANDAERLLAEVRSKSDQAANFRKGFSEFERALGFEAAQLSESTDAVLSRFKTEIERREQYFGTRVTARSSLQSNLLSLLKQRDSKARLAREIGASEALLEALTQDVANFEEKMLGARELTKVAKLVRTDIVRKVFNDSLNTLWKELFIRLAPGESFVPAFALPEKDGGEVEAVLETHYRSGGRGGNPRAMLSAGNLNTAALTLFLALHLSVEPKLPCLIIDDPVQSMDEVHIAQLAALLRVLSRQNGRQIVIAVHEKQLFEYLSLELFPAFEGDRLITVELSKNDEGASFAKHEIITYKKDPALEAA